MSRRLKNTALGLSKPPALPSPAGDCLTQYDCEGRAEEWERELDLHQRFSAYGANEIVCFSIPPRRVSGVDRSSISQTWKRARSPLPTPCLAGEVPHQMLRVDLLGDLGRQRKRLAAGVVNAGPAGAINNLCRPRCRRKICFSQSLQNVNIGFLTWKIAAK